MKPKEMTAKSHPTWVRGLKPYGYTFALPVGKVAPYVGAWIETDRRRQGPASLHVAPYVGAWIETELTARTWIPTIKSHPTWVRGLKLPKRNDYNGVWWSHPTWVRGLKHLTLPINLLVKYKSHPTWVRGLKPSGKSQC